MIESYCVYDKKGQYIAGYSTKLDGNPLVMANMTLRYHVGGEVRARYDDGTEKVVVSVAKK